jgi:hypothetical protein
MRAVSGWVLVVAGVAGCDTPDVDGRGAAEDATDAAIVAIDDQADVPADPAAYCRDRATVLRLKGCPRDARPFESICMHHLTGIPHDGCPAAFVDVADCEVLETVGCGWEHAECAALDDHRRRTCLPEDY